MTTWRASSNGWRPANGSSTTRTVEARKDGTRVDVALTVSSVRDKHGEVVGTSTIVRDVSAVVRYREQLRYLADHDGLTGLLNRRGFEQDLAEQLSRARRYGERAAVMLVDIDHFKQVNDALGHRAGDSALEAVARAFRHRLRKTDVIARLGGDELAVLLPHADDEVAKTVAEELRSTISELRLHLGGDREVHLSVSVGAALLDRDSGAQEDVLAAADQTMYQAKFRGHRPVHSPPGPNGSVGSVTQLADH
jgi:diguanylate cyclase (GGDEF)-like protein